MIAQRFVQAVSILLLAVPAGAVEVFSSGVLPDLSLESSFVSGGNDPSTPAYVNHFLPSDMPAAPITVRSIEFYGYSIHLPPISDGLLEYELIIGADPINVLAIDRTDVGPPVVSPTFGASTPVQRIRIDFDPITVEASDQFFVRGDSTEPEEFWFAAADPALAGFVYQVYSDASLTVLVSTSVDEAIYFSLNDAFQILAPTTPGDFTGDGAVDNNDLNLLLANWGAGVDPLPPGWDGASPTAPAIDNDELNSLLVNWGVGVASVPEPSALGLLVAAAFVGLAARL